MSVFTRTTQIFVLEPPPFMIINTLEVKKKEMSNNSVGNESVESALF
jgi:hypothetical protein